MDVYIFSIKRKITHCSMYKTEIRIDAFAQDCKYIETTQPPARATLKEKNVCIKTRTRVLKISGIS